MTRTRPRGGRRADAGMTLIEVLVAMGLFVVLGTLFLSFGIVTAKVTDDTSGAVDLNEETRIAFERLARDIRDADEITQVMPADAGSGCGADEFVGVAFTEASAATASVPQAVAYRWDADADRLILSEAIPDPEEQPILAADVSRFCVQLWSSRWSPVPADPDKGTSWAELDPPASPSTPGWWCPSELGYVDRVSVTMTASMNGHERTYATDVFLRNASIGGDVTHAC